MKKNRSGLLRGILQLSVLTSILFFFAGNLFGFWSVSFESYCPMGGIQAIVTLLKDGIMACNMTATQVVLGGVFLFVVMLFGKLFCSHLCPLGTVSEYLGRFGDRFGVRFGIPAIPDKLLRSLKYILLFFTLTLTLEAGELFCKQYDPFYATFSLFGHRVNTLFACLSIGVFVLGSVFFRLFWCKYLCPLGAISNIFKYWVGVIIVVTLLTAVFMFELGLDISVVVAIICLTGYVLEIKKVDSGKKSVLKITRHEQNCVSCGLCSRKCPQGIDVADMEMVKHPDCNICGECLSVCPKDGALSINENLNAKWLPAVVVVVLLLIGLFLGNQFEIPTVSKAWGNTEELERGKSFRLAHLDYLNCYSSSMGFVRHMKKVEGVLGASTFISSNSADIVYDPQKTDEVAIRKLLYNRSKEFVDNPQSMEEQIIVYKLRISKYLKKDDLKYVALALKGRGVYQVETQFDTEVRLLAFCEQGVTQQQISDWVNAVKVDSEFPYQVIDADKSSHTISGRGLTRRMFVPFKRTFNSFKNYPKEKIGVFEVEITDFPRNESKYSYLINYVGKKFPGVVGLEALFEDKAKARFYYVKDMVDANSIFEIINAGELTLKYSNGDVETMVNPYSFKML